MAKFYQTFKVELIPIFIYVFQGIEREGYTKLIPSITLISKPNKDTTRTETYTPISLMNIDTYSQQNTCKQNSTANQKDHTP
jgi:hypothetical protein